MVSLFLCLACILATACYFLKREKGLLGRLQRMLDEAAFGTFKEKHLDESQLSGIEGSMWRFLCDSQLSYQKVLRQKEQLQELVSDISHQAVTPISNILLYAQLLQEDYLLSIEQRQPVPQGQGHDVLKTGQPMRQGLDDKALGAGPEWPDSEVLEELQGILGQTEKLDSLIQSLVKLSRLETGILTVTPKKQCIGPVLQEVRQQYLLKASKKGIRLAVEDSMEMAVFDRKWTMEALANLVDNAIKYTPDGGNVSVHVLPYPMFLRVDVEDTGIGIPQAEQGKIFTRFYRCARAAEQQGVGIGLHLAREVMKAQHGYMKVASAEGRGSTFSMFFLKN